VVFGLFGARQGAMPQFLQLAALGIGYLCSRPLGRALGPSLAQSLHLPILFGVLAATILVFVVVMMAVRLLLGRFVGAVNRLIGPAPRRIDGGLGFALGGLKVTLIAYLLLSALSFVEDNVAGSAKQLGPLSPDDSITFSIVRKYNFFELVQYRPVKDLLLIAQSLGDPAKAAKLQRDPAFRALAQDPRFERTLEDDSMQRAIETGDTRVLLRRDEVLRLLQTPAIAARLKAASDAAQRP
jgi:membrane protein required for colicin V production